LRKAVQETGAALEEPVIEFVAARVGGDVRALQGAVHTLMMNSMAYDAPIDLAFAKRVLEDIVDAPAGNPSLNEVERVVCEVCGIKSAKLQSSQRTLAVSHPRMLAMWCARKYTRSALSEIGEHFGGRSHSTVVAAQKRIEQWLRADPPGELFRGGLPLRDAVKRIEQRLKIS
jgi:chromosomal replication initiator protein